MGQIEVKLRYSHTTADYVVGEDEHGSQRWFRRTGEVPFEITGDDLVVVVDETAWKRRQKSYAPDKVETKKRKCLSCRNEFAAEKNQYVCNSCKSTHNWRQGYNSFEGVY